MEAAKQFLKGMGLDNPQVVFFKELTPGFTFFNCYGSATHTVDFTVIHVPKVESTVMDMPATRPPTSTSGRISDASSW